jgi:hypothetical protein
MPGQLRSAVTPCAENNLKAVFGERSHKQRRKNALGADRLGQFFEGGLIERMARIGLRFVQERE